MLSSLWSAATARPVSYTHLDVYKRQIYFLLIIAFSYFYATIQFDPVEIANNLKKNGGFIPGFRPGKPTAEDVYKRQEQRKP